MKDEKQLEDEIWWLLVNSKKWGRGPHGRTISAVMWRVKLLRKRARQQTNLKLVKAS